MKLFFAYLRQHRWGLGFALLAAAVFAVSFSLYHLPLAAVAYPLGLCAAMGLLALLGHYFCNRRRHRQLLRLLELPPDLGEQLPAPRGILEADYQQLVRKLLEAQRLQRRQSEERFDTMTAYYTHWVHQIKTPIAAMGLQLQNEDSPASRRLTADLFRVEQYVEMALAYLRLDSDSTDYVIRSCDLDAVIRQTVKKFAGEFILRKLRLVYAPVHERVLTDEKWLAVVLEQVLSNALKYTPAGEISITLADGTLCIWDTGIGIAPEDLPRIFELGYTGCNGRLDQRASGIGLYLCRRICANLGHSIRVESQPDQGTRVLIGLRRPELQVE